VQIATVLGMGMFIAVFLLLFKPFGLHDDYPNRMMIILGYGAVTSIVLAVTSIGAPLLFSRWFAEAQWTVGRELVATAVTVSLIGMANAIYSAWVFQWPLTVGVLASFQTITFIVGVIPVSFLILLRYRQQTVMYEAAAETLTEQVAVRHVDVASDLLAIEAADNYITEYWLTPKGIRQNLVRATMASVDERTDLPPSIMRCHRSWFVNLDHVDRVSGNAQGYRLHVGDGVVIPVARTRSAELERRLPHHSPLRPK
jgi:hypothetical protein